MGNIKKDLRRGRRELEELRKENRVMEDFITELETATRTLDAHVTDGAAADDADAPPQPARRRGILARLMRK